MDQNQEPTVNIWYTNLTGQLFKVRLVMHIGSRISHVMIEYVNGTTQIINHHEWACLKLAKHAYASKTENPNKELSF